MDYLYISALSSETFVSNIYHRTGDNPGFAVQKFSRLLVRGFIENGTETIALSNPPITKKYTDDLCVNYESELENGIIYKYIPFVNLPVLKHLCVLFYTFFYVLFWGMRNRKDKAVICDVLCISSSLGALIASKLCGLKSVAVVTDIYEQMVGEKSTGFNAFLKDLAGALNKKFVTAFNRYVLLTEAMNEIVNPNHKPYVVMEGLCDLDVPDVVEVKQKSFPRVVFYAGGIESKYGLQMLVEAFKMLEYDDVELHIYGNGTYVDTLKAETLIDKRIKYFGVKSNKEIVQEELKATLLVNPRFTTEEFTKYSFPSKNMEYMVSGTPLLTTNLPGMPKDYHPYVYLFDNETVEGYADTLRCILSLSSDELQTKGKAAREYVLNNKNYIKQAAKVSFVIAD